MSDSKIYTGSRANEIMSNKLISDDIIVIDPFYDIIITGKKIGLILLSKGKTINYNPQDDTYETSDFTPGQLKNFEGSFAVYAYYTSLVSHLFKNFMTGKYYKNNIIFDRGYEMVSNQFVQILKHYVNWARRLGYV